jgi:hypothetical protein
MISSALDLLTLFVGLYLLVAIARLALLIAQFRNAGVRAAAAEHLGQQRLLEHRAGAEEYQRRNLEIQERSAALALRSEENNARYEALQDRREVLHLREEAIADRATANLEKAEALLARIERKLDGL